MNRLAPFAASPIYRSGEIRQVELAASSQPDAPPLMERAGIAAAGLVSNISDNRKAVLVLAGPGNNGGDALVAARHLKRMWFKVTVVLAGERDKLPADAANALRAWLDEGGELVSDIPPGGKWDLIIDGLFGIGLVRELEGRYRELVEQVNRMALPVLALDVPSGLGSDTGRILGAAVRASHTLTYIGLKPGLLTADGPDYCGQLHLDTLGLAPELLPPASGRLISRAEVASFLNPRPRNCHKGLLGSVGILGGAAGMVGAALLAGRAALKLGAGRVYVGLAGDGPAVDMAQPELMLRDSASLLELTNLRCMVAGPGLGQSEDTRRALEQALDGGLPLVLDADALNFIAAHPELQARLRKRQAGAVLTPHPAEASRLLGCTVQDIQRDRVNAAIELAARFHASAALKGAGTVCALPDGRWFINPTGNPGLSGAGTGDVLAGVTGALLAQGLPPDQAMLLGVFLHGAAADELVAAGIGPIGLTASELIDRVRLLLNRWIYPNTETERPAAQ